MTEFLFNTSMLTDMGCTYRLFDRQALQRIRPFLTIGGSHFGPQLLMEVIAHRIPFIEIPVNYRRRVGESSVTGDLWKAFWLGMRMIALVLSYRLGLHRAARVRWDDSSRRQTSVLPHNVGRTSGESDQSLSRLGQALRQESEATTSLDKVAKP
jgi:hypothetical protein